jgi:cell division protease FtsH
MLGILPWVLIIAFWIFLSRRAQQQIQGGPGGVFSFGASKAKLFDTKKPTTTFNTDFHRVYKRH